MKFTKRDAAILGVFVVVVALLCAGYIWNATRPVSSGGATLATSLSPQSEGLEKSEVEAVNALLDESRIEAITTSGLYDPLIVRGGLVSGSAALQGPAATGVQVETTRVYEVSPPQSDRGMPEQGTNPDLGAGLGAGPEGPQTVVKKLAAIDVAITGVVLGGKTARALVWSNPEETSKWIDVPGEAFGYQVRYVTIKGAILEKEGRMYVLLLGANKKKTADYRVAGAESGRSGPEAAPQPPPQQADGGSSQPSEMRGRMDAARFRYGMGGGRFRGPRGGPPAMPMGGP